MKERGHHIPDCILLAVLERKVIADRLSKLFTAIVDSCHSLQSLSKCVFTEHFFLVSVLEGLFHEQFAYRCYCSSAYYKM